MDFSRIIVLVGDREASPKGYSFAYAKAYRSVTDRESFRAYPLGFPEGNRLGDYPTHNQADQCQ